MVCLFHLLELLLLLNLLMLVCQMSLFYHNLSLKLMNLLMLVCQ